MTASLALVVAIGVASASPVVDAANKNPAAPRSAFDIRASVERLLSAESSSKTAAERATALRDMATLAREISAHPTLGKHTAASLRGRLVARLRRAAAELQTARVAATKKADGAPRDASPRPAVATIPMRPADQALLAQRGGGGIAFDGAADIDGGEALAELIQETIAPATWERNGGNGVIGFFGHRAGNNDGILAQVPAQGNNPARQGPALATLTEDASEELVAFIHEVIAPQSWDVNGGPGAAIAFKPKHALVVRATGEVHEALFDVVDQLRRE